MRAPKARLSPFSLPGLHAGSKVRPRTRLPGFEYRLPTSAADPPLPLELCLPCLAAHCVASAAELLRLETMRARPEYMVMNEHVNFGRTYPKL